MSYDNLPDDWGSYYSNCGECGRKYHASEGGCSCGLPSKRPWLEDAGYTYHGEDGYWSRQISRHIRTARRDHKDGRIRAGDRYVEKRSIEVDDTTGRSSRVTRKKKVKSYVELPEF